MYHSYVSSATACPEKNMLSQNCMKKSRDAFTATIDRLFHGFKVIINKHADKTVPTQYLRCSPGSNSACICVQTKCLSTGHLSSWVSLNTLHIFAVTHPRGRWARGTETMHTVRVFFGRPTTKMLGIVLCLGVKRTLTMYQTAPVSNSLTPSTCSH